MREDAIKNPNHYTSGNVECIEYTRHMDFNHGNAFKYVYRCNHKGTKDQDLGKALQYIEFIKQDKSRVLSSLEVTDEMRDGILSMDISENLRGALACICHSSISQRKFGRYDMAMISMAEKNITEEIGS
ncbi:MAG: hypothetical protein GOVbin631_26 [Prokaryotic dsDNA virus sp.]|nr:MAG: hypothetical protein GOVbin631_26 [Prokaryotic dsDNA virus sp.]|tara:strand:- start:10416 stop:10802 length:387 start_codon:yes stop_codon:yes gene_type:complete